MYQQRLPALLIEVRRQQTVPNVVVTDLLCLPEDLGYFLRQSILLVQGVSLRGAYAGSERGVLRVAECGAVQRTGVGPPEVFLEGPGLVGAIGGLFFVVRADSVDTVLL